MVLQNYIVNRKKGTPTMAEEKETKNPVQSAERIFQVLEMLAEHGEMGLMEISTELGLHKSTVHRLLMSLIYMGYAKQDETTQKYMLSYKIVSMAGKILERTDILQIAKPYMERLSDISGEAVHLVQREGNNILYIYKIEAKVGTIRMVSHVGMVHPMYCSGVGKAIMATLPEKEVKQIWNESIIEKKTDKTITDIDEMMQVLEEVRKNGYALDDEENEEGVRCIAACLHGYSKEVKYAFSISGPVSRMTRERVEELAVDVKKVQEMLIESFDSQNPQPYSIPVDSQEDVKKVKAYGGNPVVVPSGVAKLLKEEKEKRIKTLMEIPCASVMTLKDKFNRWYDIYAEKLPPEAQVEIRNLIEELE